MNMMPKFSPQESKHLKETLGVDTQNCAPLVGLYSPYPGCGKTSIAKALSLCSIRFSWEVCSFAEPVKGLTESLLLSLGYSYPQALEMTRGYDKEKPIEALSSQPGIPITPRVLMQTLGTEWGRQMIDKDIWVKAGMSRAENLMESGHAVVFDDVRFPNEATAILSAGGILVKVLRGNPDMTSRGHPSEGNLDDWQFDMTVYNDGDDLVEDVKQIALGIEDRLFE